MSRFYPRSLLFVPGHREPMVTKATSRNADAIVFDLEDSVPPSEKAAARKVVAGALNKRDSPAAILRYIRINPPRFDMLDEDFALLDSHPDVGVVVPKVDRPVELEAVFDRIGRYERDLIVNIETPRAILQLQAFADAPGVGGLFLGGEDLTESLGMRRTSEGTELAIPRFLMLTACRAAGIAAYDTICPEFSDLNVIRRDATAANTLGYDGKFAIHPAQIEPIQQAFTPSDDEVFEARKVVEAYDHAVAEGRGAVAVDGKMIDPPVAERMRAILARAEAR